MFTSHFSLGPPNSAKCHDCRPPSYVQVMLNPGKLIRGPPSSGNIGLWQTPCPWATIPEPDILAVAPSGKASLFSLTLPFPQLMLPKAFVLPPKTSSSYCGEALAQAGQGSCSCPVPGRAQGRVGQGLEHPTGLVADRAVKETLTHPLRVV